MPDYPYAILAREGWPFLALFAVLTALSAFFALWWLALPFFLLLLFSLQFFRDPRRPLPAALPGGVLCPADGRVIAIEEVDDPFLHRPALKISIFMNVFDVHVNRLPVAGVVRERWYLPGRFFNASLDKASAENERNALWMLTEDGQDVTVVQVAGLVARRILCYVRPGENCRLGQRFGFIRFGSRVDTYLPLSATPLVHLGQRLRSGAEWMAQLQVDA
jgi:phosphatidylserine decarboxylase